MPNKIENWIGTYTGKKFDPLNPKPEDIDIMDISHPLSLICRFNGHSQFFYSVAQHSLHIKELLEKEGFSLRLQLLGLLHDASEAYICDMPKPLKPVLSDYVSLEEKVQGAVYEKIGIVPPNSEEKALIKRYDNMLFLCEAKQVIGRYNTLNLNFSQELSVKIKYEPPVSVEKKFLKTLKSLVKYNKEN